MLWLTDILYFLAGLVYLPFAIYNALVLRKNRRDWGQRFGFVPTFAPSRNRIWIHGVSLGEINSTPKLVAALRERLPDYDIVVSSTTDTGYQRAVTLFGQPNVFRFPLDFSFAMRKALRRIAPSLIVLMELEVWPNLVRMASRKGISVAVVSGRLTERSSRRLAMLGKPIRSVFAKLAWVGAQDETIATRFRKLGVPPERIEVTSSLKWDTAEITDRVSGQDDLAKELGLTDQNLLWVCGSTGPGEESIILDAYRALSLSKIPTILCVVPRKPERFEEVAELISSSGFRCLRRSKKQALLLDQQRDVQRSNNVLLGDTMGELRRFYALADFVFIGRSLVPLGGSDPIEAAALAKPLLWGPHMENFLEPSLAFQQAGAAIVVNESSSLARTLESLIGDKELRRRLGQTAQEVVRSRQGATRRTVDRLVAEVEKH